MKKLLTVSFLLFVSLTLPAEIRLPSIITDGMVIQRERPVHIWGEADEKEAVTIAWKGAEYKTKADGDGKWSIELPASEAGGPFTMKKRGSLHLYPVFRRIFRNACSFIRRKARETS